MEYLLDVHTHTLASGHAYNTMTEMVEAAAEKGLKILGIADHAPLMPGTCHEFYFQNLVAVNREYYLEKYGVKLLLGAELNIVDYRGRVDLPEPTLKRLDYCVASMHRPCLKYGSREENTQAAISVMDNPHVKILGHCDNPRFPADYEKLAFEARKQNVIFEINEASLAPYSYRGDTRSNNREILRCCRKYRLPVILSSDSHGKEHVGDFTYAADFVHQEMFPENLILNNQLHRLKVFLQTRG